MLETFKADVAIVGAGGDWLCERDVVEYFVGQAHEEMVQMEHWGCPWSRTADGHANVRAFGGMKIERTWFAADRTGFHMLHTLFQTSIKYPGIKRFDEHFCVDLVVDDGRVQGVVAIDIASGEFTLIQAKAVIIATGGAGRVFRENTNGGNVTGDGMALAYRHGVPLRGMEFVQYHPTCMPGTGLPFTEACRGEGGFLLNKNGYRYLQDYGLGPAEPTPRNKAMELGPRDRLSQAYWHEKQKGRTIGGPHGHVVHLDLRHLGEKKLRERLPQIYELAVAYLGVASVGIRGDGVPVNLSDIRVPIFNLGTVQDHVAPWRSVFKLHALTDADQTFVLTAGGHNVGIVNPPGHAKSSYRLRRRRAGDRLPTPDEWLAAAASAAGSWWTPWVKWLRQHSTRQVAPPSMSSAEAGLPPLDAAPGRCGHQR